ncbi:MAG: sodium:solute symporter family protein [Fidelibacterota bacterium]|jgi:SSS family solute:Na+ symporter/sodium/pantothenate symporter|nr:sodium:solute symporter family protein [Candidatus Neomarinimicrobiota bacterium]
MNSETALLGPGGIAFLCVYILSLILIGWLGKKAQKENSLSDFYLAGRSMGFLVLFLTLYATQYSGNTLVGFAGRAYREGYQALVLVTFLSSAVGAFIVYAPKLYRLSKKYNFITPADYIHFRFKNTKLTLFAASLCLIALANYILTNLKAIGYIVVSVTGGVIPFAYGVIALSLVMVVYETMGGMRSVAWTDSLQGIILMFGVITIFITIQIEYGGFEFIYNAIQTSDPQKFIPPNFTQKLSWLSTICLGFFGISIYPHAIQRIYSANNEGSLKKSIQIMAFMPIITALFMVVVGLTALALFPGLDRQTSEGATLLVLKDLSQRGAIGSGMMVLFLSATIAAIMSTVDSALLSMSSIITKDFYKRFRPAKSQAELTNIGKMISWAIMAFSVYLAIVLPQTIWRLLEIKLELLIQVSPAIFLGLYYKKIKASSILWGMTLGTLFAVGTMVANKLGMDISAKPWGIHAGVWGLIINLTIVFILEKIKRPSVE